MNLWHRAARSIAFGPVPEARPDLGPCWISSLSGPRGYASIKDGPTKKRMHRVVYEHLIGPIPVGLELDHLCRVRNCVCPFHLEPVPQRTNLMRGFSPTAINARKTHCPNGHSYTEENTYRPPGRPMRVCRTCARIQGIQEREAAALLRPKVATVTCRHCSQEVLSPVSGRPLLYCSNRCKKRARKLRLPLGTPA